jgi:hypothetical protein
VSKICRNALLSILALLAVQPATLFVPVARAAAGPAADAIGRKKNKKFKMKKSKKIKLKGHHGSHKGKPA